MADIRCPMCGRPNPAELETCVFCQARLKPLVQPPAAPETPTSPQKDDSGASAEDLKRFLRPHEESSSESPFQNEEYSWLGRLGGTEESAQPFTASQAPTGDEQEEPTDWLDSIRKRSEEDGLHAEPPLGVPNLNPSPAGEASDPDWLLNLRAEEPGPQEPVESAGEPAGTSSETPDWLARISELRASEPPPESFPDLSEVAPAKPEPAQPEEDFFSPFSSELEPKVAPGQPGSLWSYEEPAAPEAEKPAEPEPLPEPLAELPAQEPAIDEHEAVAPEVPAGTPAEVQAEAQAEVQGEPGEEIPAQAPVEAQGPEWEPGWAPDWLQELEAKAPPVGPTSFDVGKPLVLGDAGIPAGKAESQNALPDWLQELNHAKTGKDEEPASPTPGGAEDFIAPAEIPSWLQAMRPIETVASIPPVKPEREDRVEDQGPLAGLKGILPSEPTATDFHHTTLYTTHLDITERQQSHSDLLKNLIAGESEPLPAIRTGPVATQRILRLAIALVLLVGLLVPIVANTQAVPIPDTPPQEVLWANETIDSLSDGDPVLLVIDYSPALAGELEAASAGIVDHLMSRGARIAIVSTTPTGPALASHLFNQVYRQPELYLAPYQAGEKQVNLGYLPGGLAGLAAFADHPQDTLYYDVNNLPAWSNPALLGVNSLNNFAQVILLTDNVDVGRAWMEQVRPRMGGNASFVLATSAQAAPVMRAYLDSGQIQGMVSGLVGGAAYEQMRGRTLISRAYWDAYQVGILIAVLSIAFGVLYYLITPYLKEQKPRKEAAL